jgi:hypothetical protein
MFQPTKNKYTVAQWSEISDADIRATLRHMRGFPEIHRVWLLPIRWNHDKTGEAFVEAFAEKPDDSAREYELALVWLDTKERNVQVTLNEVLPIKVKRPKD